jgi:hypothetical protein
LNEQSAGPSQECDFFHVATISDKLFPIKLNKTKLTGVESRVKNVSFTPKTLFLGYFGHFDHRSITTAGSQTYGQA